MEQRRGILEGQQRPRRSVAVRLRKKSTRKVPASIMFLAFVLVAGVGYVAGTFNTQIFSAIGPIFGVRTYAGSLDLSSVQETYRQIKANYDGDVNDKALIDGANKGLVSALGDTYTTYFNAVESDDFNNELSGDIGGGIGAEIGVRNGQPTVLRTLDDQPAQRTP